MERDTLESPGFVVEDFDVILCVADGGDSLEVGCGVADVLRAGAAEGGDGRWAEAEVVIADPVTFIVA